MRLFKRKDRKGMKADRLAERIAARILWWQRRFADYLNFRLGHLSGTGMLAVWMLMVGLGAAYCLYVLVRALN